jgi:eukaryotic-like serine/threonine-protein kinase
MASARTCETCGLEVPPGAGVCPRDGTVLLAPSLARDEEITQIGFHGNPWGEEPPTRGHAAPAAWGEEPPPRNPASSNGAFYSHSGAPLPQGWGEEPPTRDPLIGMKLGEYELRSRIGVGGMGFVYDGIQPLIGKRVAVKVLRPELAQAPEQVARLLAEARAVNAIRHRGIIDIFGFGQVPDGRQYIVMEFLDGQPLDAYMAEKGRLPPTEALSILDEVLAALGAAHGAGVVHRDLKPSNIFLVREPGGTRYVKLLDFGLAKQGQSGGSARTAQTRTDMVVGTPEYMAPEQARGQAVGPMTDLYAMGVVTFEMVTGRLPFIGTSPVDLLMKHVDARPPRPSEFIPELPPALDAFILQMLTKDPEARPGSADALRQQLHRLRRTMLRPTRAQASSQGAAAATRAPTPAPSPTTEPGAPPVAEPATSAPRASEPTTAPGTPATSEATAAPVPSAASEATTAPSEAAAASPRPPTPAEPLSHALTPAEIRAAGVSSSLRGLLPVGLGVAALLAAGAVLLFRGEEPQPPAVSAPVTSTPPDPAPPPTSPVEPPTPPVEPPTTAETTPAPTPHGTPVAHPPQGAPTDPEDDKAVAQDSPEGTAAGKGRPRPAPSTSVSPNVPSRAVLLSTIEGLERDLDARAAAGENMTSARNMLKTLRQQAREARDVDARLAVARNIASWEKAYLKRQ